MTAKIHYSEAELIKLIQRIIQQVFSSHSENPPPAGTGYFTLRSAHDGRILFVTEIGENPPEKCGGRSFNSMEKGERLFAHPEHVSSWQSRDVVNDPKKYGGAIRTPDLILSFSGLPEAADETLMVVVALESGWLDKSSAVNILNTSGNESGKRFLEL